MRERIERFVRWLIKRYLSEDYHLHANPVSKKLYHKAPVPEFTFEGKNEHE